MKRIHKYMSITIHIKEDLEKWLRQRAEAEGYHLDDYIVKMLEAQAQHKAGLEYKERELELLQKINLGLPADIWVRYAELKEKRQFETLLPDEWTELIDITDRIEVANAQRMPYLIELARLRQISLDQLIQQLDIQN
ncbi:MAG: hypothetical protein JNK77_17260 [Saprospiraceae bacterium]|nr:hypothetical protein [Saprospiraceae bacterium]